MSSLTEHNTLNTVTDQFDVQYRSFSGPNWELFIKNGLSSLSSWTAPDTNKPGAWTEITDRVSFTGRFAQQWQGSSITWSADLSGFGYDEALMGLGIGVICWRRIWRPTGTVSAPAGWQAWAVEFIGEFVSKLNTRDYRPGGTWQRTVAGYDNYLAHYNAPRITAGKVRVMEGALVTGTPELIHTELEADRGEFVGGTFTNDLDNVIDGNHNTVYISDTVPSATDLPWPPVLWDGGVQITEVFFKPLAGWSTASTWWVEVFNARSQNAESSCNFKYATRAVGGAITYFNGSDADYKKWPTLQTGACALFVGNKPMFDAYQGSNNNGAEFTHDVSIYSGAAMTLDGAVMAGNQVIAWAPGGASRTYDFGGGMTWNGATLDSTACPAGYSYLWDVATSAWVVNDKPHPGANHTGVGPIWIKAELADNVCLTLDQISAASTTIRLDNYRGWVSPDWDSLDVAYGVIAGCRFSWSQRDASVGLKNVTWINVPGAPIPAGTRCYPYADSIQQTGLPLTSVSLVRRKLPTIKTYGVYWSPTTARDYLTGGWPSDYYAHSHAQFDNSQNLRLSDSLSDGTLPYLWVRTVMWLIYGMTDDGRCKINEIEAELYQKALDLGGTPDLDGQDAPALGQYLWSTWAGLPAADMHKSITAGSHKMGQHALAITPIQKVLDDLAGATGCLVWYEPTGGMRWLDNPWWPKSADREYMYTFDKAAVQGAFESSETPVYIDYVILNALSLDGDAHTLRYIYPQPYNASEPPVWAMTQEINDRVIATDSDAPDVASMELARIVNSGRELRITVKGVGEWCRPGMRVYTSYDADGDGYVETRAWLIEAVVTQRDVDAKGVKRVATSLTLRGFRG